MEPIPNAFEDKPIYKAKDSKNAESLLSLISLFKRHGLEEEALTLERLYIARSNFLHAKSQNKSGKFAASLKDRKIEASQLRKKLIANPPKSKTGGNIYPSQYGIIHHYIIVECSCI